MKALEAEWEDYRRKVIPLHAGEVQVAESRRAFFAGAASVYNLITERLEPGQEATDNDLKFLDDLNTELREFAKAVRSGKS